MSPPALGTGTAPSPFLPAPPRLRKPQAQEASAWPQAPQSLPREAQPLPILPSGRPQGTSPDPHPRMDPAQLQVPKEQGLAPGCGQGNRGPRTAPICPPSTQTPSTACPKDTEDDSPEAGGESHAGIALPCHGEVGEGVWWEKGETLEDTCTPLGFSGRCLAAGSSSHAAGAPRSPYPRCCCPRPAASGPAPCCSAGRRCPRSAGCSPAPWPRR